LKEKAMNSNKNQAEKLLKKMTLDEKLAQIGSFWIFELQKNGEMDWEITAGKLKNGIGQITRLAGGSTYEPQKVAKTANKLQQFLVNKTRLGIPAILHEECCMGAVVLGGTTYPHMLGLASTFQDELAERMTREIRKQLMAVGTRQGLAPVLDIATDPRWGRVEETFGEDPLLVSRFGTAYIKGLQSDDLSQGVIATAKHFIGHSISQGGLNCAPVHIGLREIHETYMAPFQAAIQDARVASIMNSYPELDGDVAAASPRILTDLLRDELGFDGLLVSDYEAVIMLHNFHFIAETPAKAAVLALKAGIEVELPTIECYGDPLREALENGDISLEIVDKAVQRHLQLKLELGLFENPYVDEGQVVETFETNEQRNLAREIAAKSMVLLKNDGLLPFAKDINTLAVIGPNADSERNLLGDYSYTSMSELMRIQIPENPFFRESYQDNLTPHQVKVTTILDGIRSAVSKKTRVLYASGCDNQSDDTSGFKEAVAAAGKADAVVLVLGDKSGLTPSCTTGETRDCANLRLPEVQEALANAIMEVGKPVALVLVNGRPYAFPELTEKLVAILEAWLPGEEGGNAVADILFGDVNPGGKLPITFPRSAGQLPLVYNAKPSGRRSHWYGDYTDEKVIPLFPFGHGLSYTSFKYSDLQIDPVEVSAGGEVLISVRVANTGKVAGDEVTQLYTHQTYASIPRPIKELKGYQRLTLEAGEVQRVTFHLPANMLAFYGHDLKLRLEPGDVEVLVGSSSEDIRLSGAITITGEAAMHVEKRVFVCPVEVENVS
jgi:beta-glucosidase